MSMRRPLLPEMGAALARPQLRAMARPAGKRPDLRVQALADGEAEVRIYDQIAWFAVSAEDVTRQLEKIDAHTIHLRINSPGGDVFDGIAIYNAFVRHPAKVIAHVDGIAASAASIIALAGDEVEMAEGSAVMVHSAWGLVVGNVRDLRKTADLLEQVDGALAGIYSRQMDISREEALALMEAETWMFADDAVSRGFADRVAERPAVEAAFDLSIYSNTPERLAAQRQRELRAEPPRTLRDFEAQLREQLGFSRAEAQRIAAAGFDRSPARDEPAAVDLSPLQELAASLRSLSPR